MNTDEEHYHWNTPSMNARRGRTTKREHTQYEHEEEQSKENIHIKVIKEEQSKESADSMSTRKNNQKRTYT